MKRRKLMQIGAITLALVCAMVARAQDDIPLLRPEEAAAVDRQSEQFNKAIEPVLERAARSTVRIWQGRARLAYGTVIGDGRRIVTKWSEVDRVKGAKLVVESADGQGLSARIIGVHADDDLAILEIEGEPLTPVVWSEQEPRLGSFLAAPQPNGRLAGFGVLSVMERNLRETDRAYLGVVGEIGFAGPGVKVREVSEGSGAEAAGLKAGDVILKVGERGISGLMELKNALVAVEPGDEVKLQVEREGNSRSVRVVLGNRPEFPNYLGARLAQMERMGTRLNQVRDSFSSAIQTDMRIQPNQVGGPVVNLKGEVVGITLARADRTRSFVMSAKALREVLDEKPQDALLARTQRAKELAESAEAARQLRGNRPPRGQATPQQLESHLKQMRRLMRFMEREMDALEGR